jgi:hypothetical protein
MNTIDAVARDELRLLAEIQGQPCVSIYMPTHRVTPEAQQDPIRLKNLLVEAEKRLVAQGLRTPEARALVGMANDLLPRSSFWQHQADGLAVLLAPEVFRYYQLPYEVDELMVVGRRLHLKLLLRLLRPDGQFFVLALSQNQVRLLEGSRHAVREVDLANVPQSLAEALKYDVLEKQVQFHTVGPAGGRGGTPMFHGHGEGADDTKSRILRYFHQIDDGLREWLGPSTAPLVLAGVEYLHPLYREANNYPSLVAEGLYGNPDELRAGELHARAWDIVRPIIIQTREADVDRFRQLAGTADPLGATNVTEIAPAAHFGRVDTLFVRMGSQQWGRFDPGSGEVELLDQPSTDAEDLLDLAAVQTYLNGGTVYVVPAEQMPGPEPVAAIFRY